MLELILENEELFWGTATRSNKFNVDGRNLVYARFALFFKLLRQGICAAGKACR